MQYISYLCHSNTPKQICSASLAETKGFGWHEYFKGMFNLCLRVSQSWSVQQPSKKVPQFHWEHKTLHLKKKLRAQNFTPQKEIESTKIYTLKRNWEHRVKLYTLKRNWEHRVKLNTSKRNEHAVKLCTWRIEGTQYCFLLKNKSKGGFKETVWLKLLRLF